MSTKFRSGVTLLALLVTSASLTAALTGAQLQAQAAPKPPAPRAVDGAPRAADGVGTAADDTSPVVPDDILGRATSSTVLRADSLGLSGFAGPGRAASEYARTGADMSSFTTITKPVGIDSRRALTPNVVTAAARPLDVDRDRVLSWQQSAADNAAIWQLTASSTKSEPNWHNADQPASPDTLRAGRTYTLTQGSAGLTAPSDSARFETSYGTAPADKTSAWQQFTLRSAPGGGFRLVNQADGLCANLLNADPNDTAVIGTWPCADPTDVSTNDAWNLRPAPAGDAFTVVNKSSGKLLTNLGNGAVGQRSANGAGQQTWHLTEIVQPGGTIPSWSTPASTTAGMASALVSGDLDRVVNGNDRYGDEAAVAFVGDDHKLQVRVIDYNANDDHLLVTTPEGDGGVSLPAIGGPGDGSGAWFPGSIGLAIGNFTGQDANGQRDNELAVTWQDPRGLHVTFLSYQAAGATRRLNVLGPDVLLAKDTSTDPTRPTLSLVAGMAHTTVGDFDGDDKDDLAVSYVANSKPVVSVATFRDNGASVVVAANSGPTALFSDALKDRILSYPNMGTIWSARGVKLVAGLFELDNDAGKTIRQRQLVAVVNLWGENTKDRSTDESTWQANLDVTSTPGSITVTSKDAQVGATTNFKGNQSDSFPLSVTAGGFAGRGNANDDATPTWGLALAARAKSGSAIGSQTSILRPQGDGTFATALQSFNGNGSELRLQAYDQAGSSIVLGAPLVATTEQYQPVVIAAQPPTHADWLNGDFLNVSRNSDFIVKMGDSTTTETSTVATTKASTSIGVSEAFDAKTTVKEGLFGISSLGASFDFSQKFTQEKGRETETGKAFEKSYTYTVDATTNDDDVLEGLHVFNSIYRYPILGGPLRNADGSPVSTAKCTEACYGYYEVIVPNSAQKLKVSNGRDDEYYQPTWQNGNALSYPPLVDGEVDLADVGRYDLNGQELKKRIGETDYSVSTNELAEMLKMDDSTRDSTDRTSSGSLTNSQEVEVGTKVQFRIGASKASQSFTLSSGVDEQSTWATSEIVENKTTTSKEFSLEVPRIASSSQTYQVGTAFYVDKAGAQKVVHGVDLSSSRSGSSFWQTTYGTKPDPALNLPYGSNTVEDKLGRFKDLKWNSYDNRQTIRGFYALQPVDASNPATSGQPYTDNPHVGDRMTFQVMVHNYSLLKSPSVRAAFYAQPVDTSGTDVIRQPQLFGYSTVPAMDKQGMVAVNSPEWVAETGVNGSSLQRWRIYVMLDDNNQVDEVHEWQAGAAQKVCPAESIEPAANEPVEFLSDTTKEGTDAAETLACGQNNQGYGEIKVSSDQLPQAARTAAGTPTAGTNAGATTSQEPVDHAVTGVRFKTGKGADAPVRGGVVQTVVNENLLAVVQTSASTSSNAISQVLVFDGEPSADRLVAHLKLSGVDSRAGGSGSFTWKPTTPGLHELHAILLTQGRQVIKKSAQINVAKHAAAKRVLLLPDKSSARVGELVRFRTSTIDAYGNQVRNITPRARLTISPDGWCRAAACTTGKPGPHTITGRFGALRGTATLVATPRRSTPSTQRPVPTKPSSTQPTPTQPTPTQPTRRRTGR